MTTSKRWIVVAYVAGVSVLSGLAGGLIGHRVARTEMEHRANPRHWNEHVAREFERIVRPTAEQAPRIDRHLERAVADLEGIRASTIRQSTNVIWRLVGEVESELTPEQRKAFEVLKPRPEDLDLGVLDISPAR